MWGSGPSGNEDWGVGTMSSERQIFLIELLSWILNKLMLWTLQKFFLIQLQKPLNWVELLNKIIAFFLLNYWVEFLIENI